MLSLLFLRAPIRYGSGYNGAMKTLDAPVLNRLLDQPEALEYDPMLVQRLRRLRETRRRTRFARRLGHGG